MAHRHRVCRRWQRQSPWRSQLRNRRISCNQFESVRMQFGDQRLEDAVTTPRCRRRAGYDGRKFGLDRQIARLDFLDTGLSHVGPRLGQRAVHVNRTAGVLDHVGRETGVARIDRRPGHAEIGGEAADEDGIDAALLEIARQPRMGFLGLVRSIRKLRCCCPLGARAGNPHLAAPRMLGRVAEDGSHFRRRKL
jgi:hypothetical protein